MKNTFLTILVLPVILTTTVSTAWTQSVNSILHRAVELTGTPYRSGGMNPGGFDCSGFVVYLYKPTLPDIPRISKQIARIGTSVAARQWQPGDLLFYATGANPNQINHVAIWYSENQIIHSISGGPETGVVITPADSHYWKTRYVSARRVLPMEEVIDEVSSPESAESPGEIPPPTHREKSPWDDFDGILRGDFDVWKKADDTAFEAFKKNSVSESLLME